MPMPMIVNRSEMIRNVMRMRVMQQDERLKKVLLEWSNTFMQLSLNDLSR